LKAGLFFSSCGGMLEQTIDLKSLADEFASQVKTMVVGDFLDSKDISDIIRVVREEKLDAVVLAGNSPEEYTDSRQGRLLVDMLEDVGINPNKIAYVNLKQQVALVHRKDPVSQQKAVLLTRVALARIEEAHPVQMIRVAPRNTVAVLGKTVEGWLAAAQMLKRGLRVYLIGQTEEEMPPTLAPVKAFVELNPKTHLMEGYKVIDVYGWAGDLTIKIKSNKDEITVDVGAILVASNKRREDVEELRTILHLDTDQDSGLLVPLTMDSRMVETIEEGIFIIPNLETLDMLMRVALADAASLAVINLLEQPELLHKNLVSEVDESKCGGCGTCVKTCSFQASTVDPVRRVSQIDLRRCKGCGNCVTSCPTGARDLLTYPLAYLLKAVEILAEFGEKGEPKILALLCEGCGYKSVDDAAQANMEYSPNILPLGVRCGGAIDTQLILEAFNRGFDGITICKCADGHCSNIVGNTDLDRRANLFREILRSRGINDDLLRIVDSGGRGDNYCVNTLVQLFEAVKSGEVTR